MVHVTNAQFRSARDLKYVPPAGATPEGIRKAEELTAMPMIAKKVNGVRPPDLEVLCREYDPKPSKRFIPNRGSKLRNKAYLVALILEGMGFGSAIMPEWWTPHDPSPLSKKRSTPEPSSDGSSATAIDYDTSELLLSHLVHWSCFKPPAQTLGYVSRQRQHAHQST